MHLKLQLNHPYQVIGGQNLRIRKEVNTLNPEEKEKLRNALQQAMNKTTNGMLFMDLANYHGAPYTLCPLPGCCPHGHTIFLTWHRLYLGMYFNHGSFSRRQVLIYLPRNFTYVFHL